MIASWMIYLTIIATIMAGFGMAFERTLAYLNLPARYAWSWALLLSTLLPLFRMLVPHTTETVAPIPDMSQVWITNMPIAQSTPADLNLVLACMWVALAGGMGLILLSSYRQSIREVENLPTEEKDGHEFRRSTDLGPALIGTISPRIVLPALAQGSDSAGRSDCPMA